MRKTNRKANLKPETRNLKLREAGAIAAHANRSGFRFQVSGLSQVLP